jgi:hypothetical protein
MIRSKAKTVVLATEDTEVTEKTEGKKAGATGTPNAIGVLRGVTSCFFGKLLDRTCCKPPDVKKLEKPQIAQIFADSEAKKREPGPTLSVVSCLFFNLRKSAKSAAHWFWLRPKAALGPLWLPFLAFYRVVVFYGSSGFSVLAGWEPRSTNPNPEEEEAVQGKGRNHVHPPRLPANYPPSGTRRDVWRGRKDPRTAHQRTPPASYFEGHPWIQPVLFRRWPDSCSFRP